MKKIIINFSILIFLIVPAFVRAIFMVPVVDPNVIGQLEKLSRELETLLVTTGESFKQTNVLLSQLLETQFQQIASDVSVGLLKVHQYTTNVAEIETFIEERRNRVKNLEIYSEALQEAKTAGAYLALQDFINTLSCVNPRIRNEFTDYLKDINREFNLSLKTEELLNNIPDCPTEGTETITLKPSFFTWLTQPFKLNLAQITQPSSKEEIPSISITPAFQKTEDLIELSNLENLSASLIKSKAEEQEKKRIEQIGEIWPVEICTKSIVDKNINGGKILCLEYSILISGKDLERFKQEVSLNNPLNNPARSIDFFRSLNPYILTQIGITSPITTSSGLLSDLNTTTTLEQKINEYCANYNVGPTERGESGDDVDKVQTAYTKCMNEFINQFNKLTELLQKDVEQRKSMAEENQKNIEDLIDQAQKIQESIDPEFCPGAYEDLEEIIQSLEAKNEFYINARIQLNELKIEITLLRRLIDKARSEIFKLLDEAFTAIRDILPFLDIDIKKLITDIINQLLSLLQSLLLGIKIPLPIIDKIKIGPLKIEKDFVMQKLLEIVGKFNKSLGHIASISLNYKRTYDALYRAKLTYASFWYDTYETDLIRQKLDTYERLIARKACSSYEDQPEAVVLLTKSRVVVESKKEQNKSFNLFASLKNLFSPKIVEIRNEK